MTDQPPVTLLTREDLRQLGVRYCSGHILRLEQEGRFPKRVYLSPNRVAWVASEVHAFIAARVAHRRRTA